MRVTCDAFLGGRISLRQPAKGPRAGIDAVLLAAAVPGEPGERVLEAGIGAGVAAIALAHRVPGLQVTGIELQRGLVELCRENARRNGMESRLHVVCGDITAALRELEAAGLARESFHHVIANPPFRVRGQARAADDAMTVAAHMGEASDLDRWLQRLASLAAPRGVLTLIHDAAALDRVLGAMAGRFGGAVIFPLFPRRGAAAIRILVQAVKGSRAPLRLAPGLVLHEADGRFTAAAEAVLRGGEPLRLLA